MRYEMSRACAFLLALFALSFHIVPAWAQQVIPDAHLRVTVRQKENGKISQGLHIQELRCWRRECSLTSVSLNQCGESPLTGKMSFAAVVERSTTRERNLRVTNEGNTLVTVETGSDLGGTYVTTQRFRYEKPRKGEMVERLIGYSGGFVKNSTIAQQVITVDFIPLKDYTKNLNLIVQCVFLGWMLPSDEVSLVRVAQSKPSSCRSRPIFGSGIRFAI